MAYIIVTSDDLQPATLHLFEHYWKPLKEKHPELIVTFWVAPFNQEFGQDRSNLIAESDVWYKWFEENKEWIVIEPHGCTHTKPPECLNEYKDQVAMIKLVRDAMAPYIDPNVWGWKAPFYKANSEMIEALVHSGCSYYSQWWDTHLLVPQKRKLPEFVEIGTHTNVAAANNPDNIDKIFEKLDNQLTKLENLGFKYSSYRELIKEAIK